MRRSWLLTIVVFVCASAVALPLLYWLAITVSPNRTGEGHTVMPIGQVGFSIVFAPVIGALLGWRFGRSRQSGRKAP